MSAISMDALASLGVTAAGQKNALERRQDDTQAREDKLGQADFLLMMTQQLKNQDPLNPMDNGAFLAQLAQISTVQGLGDLNKKADQFLTVSGSDQALRGAALIGRQVEAPTSNLRLDNQGNAVATVQASGEGAAEVTIRDAAGAVLRTLALPGSGPGPRPLEWDGRDAAGNRLPPGDYRIAASQTGTDGTSQPLQTYGQVLVESVSLDKDGATLNLAGGQRVPLAKVLRIS